MSESQPEVNERDPLLSVNTKAPNEGNASPRQSLLFSFRLVFVLLACFGVTISYAQRATMSIAIVAMVNTTASHHRLENDSSTCPTNFQNQTSGDSPKSFPSENYEFDWSRTLQGLILSSITWGYLVFQVPGAALAHRYNPKWISMVTVLLGSGLTASMPAMARISPYLLIGGRVIVGATQAFLVPSIFTMLGRWVPKGETSLLMTIVDEGATFGALIGQLLSGWLSESRWGWPAAFYGTSMLGAVWILPWFLLGHNTPEKHPFISTKELDYLRREVAHEQSRVDGRGVPWLAILKDHATWALFVSNFTDAWIFFLIITCLPQYLSDVLHFGLMDNGLINAFACVIDIVASIFVALASDKLVASGRFSVGCVRKSMMSSGFLLAAGCLFGVTLAGCNIYAVIAFFTIVMIGAAFFGSSVASNNLDLSPEYVGSLHAICSTTEALAAGISPFIADVIATSGSRSQWNTVFYSGCVAGAVGILAFVTFGSGEKRSWSTSNERQSV